MHGLRARPDLMTYTLFFYSYWLRILIEAGFFFFFKSDFFPLSSLLTLFSFEPRMHVHSSHIFTLNSGNRVLFHTHSFSICVLVHTASYSVHYFPIVSLLRLFLLMLVMDCSVGNMRQGKFICVANVYIRTMEFSVLYTDITFWS